MKSKTPIADAVRTGGDAWKVYLDYDAKRNEFVTTRSRVALSKAHYKNEVTATRMSTRKDEHIAIPRSHSARRGQAILESGAL